MKASFFIAALLLLMGVEALSSCNSDDSNFVLRSDSQLHFSYAAGERDFTVCTDGDWSVTTQSSWLSFDKTNGTGDGATRQKIQVISARNTGAERIDSFVLHAAGRDLTVYCRQDKGAPFTFGNAKFSGSLQMGKRADLCVVLPYSYGYRGMTLKLHTALSGAGAEGLAVNDTTVTLGGETGTILLPVLGAPKSAGPVLIKVSADAADVSPVVVQTSVLSQVLLEQHFDQMVWGGDVINYQPGVMGGFMAGDGGKVVDPSVAVASCKASADGSNDLILTMSESYRRLRGFEGWDGARIYEHPGYVKIGTAKLVGTIITPALSRLSDGVTTVRVTCRVAQYLSESGGTLTIQVLGGGTPSMAAYAYQHAGKKTGCTWEDIVFTVTGVTKNTKIAFSTKGNKRFCLDDVVISEGK